MKVQDRDQAKAAYTHPEIALDQEVEEVDIHQGAAALLATGIHRRIRHTILLAVGVTMETATMEADHPLIAIRSMTTNIPKTDLPDL